MLRRWTKTVSAPASGAELAQRAQLRGSKPSALLLFSAVLAGASSILSFQPYGWWPLQLLSLAWFFYQVGVGSSVKRATLIGWAFGFGWTLAGVHWLYVFGTRFAHLPAALAVGGLVLLCLYMGLFGALTAGVGSWLRKRW